MSRIIAARYDNPAQADAALESLKREGFARNEVDTFYLPPPGQRALHRLGGDAHSDAGARKAGVGAGVGALLGGLVGLAVGLLLSREWGVVAILFGAALGAYLGSFVGAMSKMQDQRAAPATPEHPREIPGGRLIAVLAERPGMESRALEILRRHGARNVYRAEGQWRDGSWRDFDPRSPLAAA